MKTKQLTHIAIFAAIYVVATMAISPLSYGAIQCRIADIMMFFCIGNKKNWAGYAIGGLLANIISPLGVIDMAVGLLSNGVIGFCAAKTKSTVATTLVAVIATALLVGGELTAVYSTPFLANAAYVALGMMASCAMGLIFYNATKKNKKVFDIIMG